MYRFPRQTGQLPSCSMASAPTKRSRDLYPSKPAWNTSSRKYANFAARSGAIGLLVQNAAGKKHPAYAEGRRGATQEAAKAQEKLGDLSNGHVSGVNPDKFLTWFYRYTSFIYTPWFTILPLAVFALMAGLPSLIGGKLAATHCEFYNFSNKTWGDVVFSIRLLAGRHGMARNRPWARVQTLWRARRRHGLLLDLPDPGLLYRHHGRSHVLAATSG